MAVILYPGGIAGRFHLFERPGRNFGHLPRWIGGGAPQRACAGFRAQAVTCALLSQRVCRSVWENFGVVQARRRHPIRSSVFLKGTNPPKVQEKNLPPSGGNSLGWWPAQRPPCLCPPNPLFLHLVDTLTAFFLSFAKILTTTPTQHSKDVDTERPVLRQEEDGHRRRPLQGSSAKIGIEVDANPCSVSGCFEACLPSRALRMEGLGISSRGGRVLLPGSWGIKGGNA